MSTEPPTEIHFYWLREPGEVTAARSFEDFAAYAKSCEGGNYEELTEANKESEWGEYPGTMMVADEDDKEMTFLEAALRCKELPMQIATTYN